MSSAIWPLQVMLRALLMADSALTAKLAGEKVYSGRAPQDAPLDYIILGQSFETPLYTFDAAGGHRNIERLHGWTDDSSKYRATMIAADLERLLHRQQHTLNGHNLLTGEFSAIILPDSTGHYMQAMCTYEVLSYELSA